MDACNFRAASFLFLVLMERSVLEKWAAEQLEREATSSTGLLRGGTSSAGWSRRRETSLTWWSQSEVHKVSSYQIACLFHSDIPRVDQALLPRTSPSVKEHRQVKFVQWVFACVHLTQSFRLHIVWSWLFPATFLVFFAPFLLLVFLRSWVRFLFAGLVDNDIPHA